jgi:hypothetical protein
MTAEKRIIRHPVAGLLIIFGVILLTSSLIFSYLNRSGVNPKETNLPKSIAGLSLNTATYGPEAVTEITRMHGKEFPIASGAMGMYGDTNQISLWVAGFSNRSTATQIVSAMEEKIATGNSPFTPTGQQQIGDRTIFHLDGMDQKHVYFQSSNLVIWLATDPSLSDQAIQQIEEVYP